MASITDLTSTDLLDTFGSINLEDNDILDKNIPDINNNNNEDNSNNMEEIDIIDPFKELLISSSKNLPKDRILCKGCSKSYLLYCYNCAVPLIDYNLNLKPLPINIHIIHHYSELLSKATGIHAAVLYPNNVTITHYPDLPDLDPTSSVLLFPSDESIPLVEMDIVDIKKIKTFVFIDSTWQQARSIWSQPSIMELPKICITEQNTKFWRYQSLGPHCLATIEAIYYTCKEYISKFGPYNGEVDHLLFLFKHWYLMIQGKYKKTKKDFKHIKNYIK